MSAAEAAAQEEIAAGTSASDLAGSVREAVEDMAIDEQLENAHTWQQLGRAGEARAFAYLQSEGYEILGTNVYVRTAGGVRIMDIVATRPGSQVIVAYEVKANGGYRNFQQLRRDFLLQHFGGRIRSWGHPIFRYNQFVRISTGVLTVSFVGGR